MTFRERVSWAWKKITTRADREDEQKRSWFGTVLRVLFGPLVYWFGLTGHDGRPSHTKILATVSFAELLRVVVRLEDFVFSDCGAHTTELGILVSLVFLMVVVPYGLNGIKVWADSKAGGGVVSQYQKAQTEAIKARRQGTGDDHDPTPD